MASADLPHLPVAVQPSRRLTMSLLALIVLLGSALRWHGMTDRGFFFDELWNVEVSNGHAAEFFELPFDRPLAVTNPLIPETAYPIWQIPARTTGVTHPPASFIVLRLWRDAFGDSMLALRSEPAAWSTLAVLLTYVAAARSFGRPAGLWAALMSALSLANIDQAQDVRSYTTLEAVLLLTTLPLLAARGRASAWPAAIGVGLGTLVLMFTHYFAAGDCIAIGFGACLLLRGRPRWQTLAMIGAAGVIWSVLWLPHLRAQLAYVPGTADVFVHDDSAHPVLATLFRAIASPYQALVADPYAFDPKASGTVPLVGGLVVCILVAWSVLARRRGVEPSLRPTIFWLSLAVGSLGLLLAIDLGRQSKHLEFPRYVLLANPPLCVLVASLRTTRRPSWLLPALVSAALAIAYIYTPSAPKPDLRPTLAYLQAHASPNDLILLPARPQHAADAQARYLSVAYGLRWPVHRIVIPVGPKSREWIDSLPRDCRWFCLAFADYDPATWQPGLVTVDRGPVSTGVAVFEVRRATPATAPATAP